MPPLTVEFRYYPGLSFDPFVAVTLLGSWDGAGALSDGPWSSQGMNRTTADDGSVGYAATVTLDDNNQHQAFRWGVHQPFDRPSYVLAHPALEGEGWRECFNSDSTRYGGDNVGNAGAVVAPQGASLAVVVPANGVVVFSRPG